MLVLQRHSIQWPGTHADVKPHFLTVQRQQRFRVAKPSFCQLVGISIWNTCWKELTKKARLAECTLHWSATLHYAFFSCSMAVREGGRKFASLVPKVVKHSKETLWVEAIRYRTYSLWLAVCFSPAYQSSLVWSCQRLWLLRRQVCQTCLQRVLKTKNEEFKIRPHLDM